MGIVQKDAVRTMFISYAGILLGYLNKGFLFLLIFTTEEIGLINLLYSLGSLFAQFANFGTLYTTWKFFPFFRNHERKHHGFLSLMLLIVAGGITICTAIVLLFREPIERAYLDKSPQFVEYYFWFIPIGIFTVLFLIFEVYLRSIFKNIVGVFANEILLRLALMIVLILYYFHKISFSDFVIIHSLVYLVPVLIIVVYLFRIGELHIQWSAINISKKYRSIIFKFSSYFYVNTLGLVLIAALDVIMLAQLVGLNSTGVYTTILFLAGALQVPYKSIVRVGASLVAEHWKHRNMKEMRNLYGQVSSVSLVIGLGLFLGTWLNIDFLLSFLKPEFASGKWVFLYIMMGRLFDMYCGVNGSILTTSKKYRIDLLFTIALIFLVFFMNLWLIPLMGMDGAAISTSAAIILVNVGRLIYVQRVFHLHPYRRSQLYVLLLALLTLAVGQTLSAYISSRTLSFVVETVVVLVCYCLPILLFRIEPEISAYLDKALSFARSKVKG